MGSMETDMPDIEQPIMEYLNGVVAETGSPGPVTPDTGLLDSGLLDSINLVRLVQFLEEKFSIRIPDSDLGAELFASPAAITEYVSRRIA